LKTRARIEIGKAQAAIASLNQQLDATRAKIIKNNYSQLFLGISRAVQQQCL
jgi:hypothetical protein